MVALEAGISPELDSKPPQSPTHEAQRRRSQEFSFQMFIAPPLSKDRGILRRINRVPREVDPVIADSSIHINYDAQRVEIRNGDHVFSFNVGPGGIIQRGLGVVMGEGIREMATRDLSLDEADTLVGLLRDKDNTEAMQDNVSRLGILSFLTPAEEMQLRRVESRAGVDLNPGIVSEIS